MGIQLNQIMILLGAGASIPAGIPHARGFVKAVAEYLKELPLEDYQALDKVFHAACLTIADAIGCRLEEIDIEQLYRSIDESLDFNFFKDDPFSIRPLLDPCRGVERLHYEIKRCILKQCWINDFTKTSFLNGVIDELLTCHNFPIVSLNYDNIIEVFCERNNIKYYDPALNNNPLGHEQICLLKLHGSVTWAIDSSGLIKRATPHGLGGWRLTGSLRGSTLEVPIIYPTPGKVPVQMPFVAQVARLQELLFLKTGINEYKYNRCLSIGYSFRDRHVIDWFSSAFRANPDLKVVLVNLEPQKVLETLIKRDPLTDWTSRVLAAPVGNAATAFDRGIVYLANEAKPIESRSEGMARRQKWPAPLALTDRINGMTSAGDGKSIYVSTVSGRIEQHDLFFGSASIIAEKLSQNRGIATDDRGRVFFVQNQLWKSRFLPSVGAGVIREVDVQTGQLRTVNRIALSDMRAAVSEMLKTGLTRKLIGAAHYLLSWPTDLVWSQKFSRLLATEARRLAAIDPSTGQIRHADGPPLTFNLHAIDFLDDNRLIGLELGIAQSNSWSRMIEFDLERFSATSSIFDIGLPRLFDICVIPLSRVLVVQHLPAPKGAIVMFNYPPMKEIMRIDGFDLPNKIVSNPAWNFVLCSDKANIYKIPLSEFI